MMWWIISHAIAAVVGAAVSYFVLRNNIRLLKMQLRLQPPVTTKPKA